jgi:biotin carboxyl carrier protein
MPVYQVTIAERTLKVELRQAGDQLYARVDGGQEQPVRLDILHGPLRALVLGERRREFLASESAEGIRLAIDGLDYQAEVLDEVHARLAQVVGSGPLQHVRRELKAPMPGLVVKVLCEPGQQVEPGQSLVVLQAMKMENELSLPWGGTVTSISAESGQTVDQGQVLVVVE